MSPDAQKVFALLSTALHWMPTSLSIRRPSTGETPSATRTCPKCGGKGRVSRRALPCAHCNGSGTVAVDAYTQREVTTSERVVVHVSRTPCDSCSAQGVYGNGRRCPHCGGSGVRETAEHTSDSQLARLEANERIRDGLEAPDSSAELAERKERWYAHGSYAEAEQALQALPPSLRLFVTRVLVYQEPIVRTPGVDALVAHACEQMASRMSPPIRCPQWALDGTTAPGRGRWANGHAQAQRNERIRALSAEGLSPTAIGRQVGLHRESVQRVLRAGL